MTIFHGKIRNRLILTFLVPIMLLVAVFGFYAYFISRDGLEAELSKRLIAIAASASTQISVSSLMTLQPGDEDTRLYRNIKQKLNRLKEVNHVKRIYVFSLDSRAIVDTDSVPIGENYTKHTFDQAELDLVKTGIAASSILFKSDDGNLYKTGYVPVYSTLFSEGSTEMAIIGVEGNAQFYETLDRLNQNLFWLCILGVFSIIIASLIFSRRIVFPIRQLLNSVSQISAGDLDADINIIANDEIGHLGHEFNEMRKNLLERDNRMKMMLHGIAHEVRNPLGGIELFVGLLAEERKDSDSFDDYISKIKKEIRNLGNIVNEFLDYARPILITKRSVCLDEFISDLGMLLAKDLEKNNVILKMDISVQKTSVEFDTEHMKQVFLNLLKNAIQSQPNGGEILVQAHIKSVLRDGRIVQMLLLKIVDKGKGISSENQEKLFTPFFTTKEKGSGLGLALTQKIIDAHQGEISIESTLGIGTVVNILLPIA